MKYFLFIVMILSTSLSYSQNKLNFQVKDESGEPLTGANIIIEGTTKGTITNSEGIAYFDILPDGEIEFVISFIGFEEQEITLIFPQDNNKTIELTLEVGEALEEIVIAATRSSRTIQDIPTRLEAITGEELGEKAAMNSTNIGMLLSFT